MILSDGDIAAELEKGELEISPINAETQIQPASIDLRLGNHYIEFPNNGATIDTRNEDHVERFGSEKIRDSWTIEPGEFILGTTKETVKIPDYLVGQLEGRSSIGRLSIIVHCTAGIIDPGYQGEITLELSNLGNTPIRVHEGMRVSQLLLKQLKNPALKPYGRDNSKYQDQSGATGSRIYQEADEAE